MARVELCGAKKAKLLAKRDLEKAYAGMFVELKAYYYTFLAFSDFEAVEFDYPEKGTKDVVMITLDESQDLPPSTGTEAVVPPKNPAEAIVGREERPSQKVNENVLAAVEDNLIAVEARANEFEKE